MSTFKKLWGLLTRDQHRSAILLLGLLLVGMVLETGGIGLVVPAVALMTQGDPVARFPALGSVWSRFGNPSREQLVVAGMLILVAVFTVKTLFLSFLAWWQARFVYGLQASLSQRLFAGYLRQPYTFHLQRNSAELIRNIINLCGNVSSVFHQSLTLIAEVLVMVGICAMLVLIEPLGAILVMSILALAGWGFYRFTRGHVLRWGKALQWHEGLRIQHLQEGLGGAKDVKLLGREKDFLAQFGRHNTGSALVAHRQSALLQLPRLWLELLAVSGLAALVLAMLWQDKPLDSLLPTLALFAAAAFRLMPSVNRILVAVQGMRYTLPAIEILDSELSLLDGTKSPEKGGPLLPFRTALTLDRITYRYPASETDALREVSISIPSGSSVGIIGGSGAGKSTLVDIILGLLPPDGGSVKCDGVDIQTSLRGWQDQIGYVPQSIYLSDDSLRRNVAFGLNADEIDESAVNRAIKAAQLDQFISELPEGLDTLVGERGIRLSGGQRQRIGIARALYHDPPVLVLDEATSSLDTATEQGVMEAVRALQGDKTLVIVAHRMSTVEHCSRLFRLERGALVEEGEAADILRKALA